MSAITELLVKSELRNLFEKNLLGEIEQSGSVTTVEEGEVIIEPGQYIKVIPILISGNLKIIRQDSEGEILLYYIGPGETCAMSLTCCMAHQQSRIKAIAEEKTTMIVIPVQKMEEWMQHYNTWNQFIMQTYSARFDELLRTIDNISFKKVDERLLDYLKSKSEINKSAVLQVSHQQIAEELNSSREVISRLLKQLEKKGLVTLGRNRIELMDGILK
jgi:CRP/FNR family transcriptional regulator, anaerobic regulatory protein